MIDYEHDHEEENGEGGIRTLGTLLGYGALAKRCFRPLSHLTKSAVIDRRYNFQSRENMTRDGGLPTVSVAHDRREW
jgi:hypothetical protein